MEKLARDRVARPVAVLAAVRVDSADGERLCEGDAVKEGEDFAEDEVNGEKLTVVVVVDVRDTLPVKVVQGDTELHTLQLPLEDSVGAIETEGSKEGDATYDLEDEPEFPITVTVLVPLAGAEGDELKLPDTLGEPVPMLVEEAASVQLCVPVPAAETVFTPVSEKGTEGVKSVETDAPPDGVRETVVVREGTREAVFPDPEAAAEVVIATVPVASLVALAIEEADANALLTDTDAVLLVEELEVRDV